MDKDVLIGKVLEFAGKIQSNKYLSAVSQGLMQTLPILMIGSIALLLAVLPVTPWNNFITSTGMFTYLLMAATMTTSMLALYSSFCIGNQLAKFYNQDGVAAGLISVFSFLIMIPMKDGALDQSWLSAQGLFTAIIATLLASRLYILLLEKKVTIRMPDGVPPFVSRTFSSLIPGIIVGFAAMFVSYLFSFTSYGSFAQFIYTVVSLPLQGLSGSVWSLVFIVLIQMFLWFFGIHGSLVVGTFITALYLPLDTMNMEALAAGTPLPNILGKSFYDLFAGIGGAGGTLSLLILILLISKSQKNKALGKLAILPGFFTINEPVVFGYPLILNPILGIPFILTPLIQCVVAYGAIAIGLVPRLSGVQVAFGIPVFVNGFIAGGWKVAVLQAFLIFVGMVVYFPFFKLSDKKEYQLEIENTSTDGLKLEKGV